MALAVTDRGTIQTTAGTTDNTETSGSLSPTSGNLYVLGLTLNMATSGTGQAVITVSDSLASTWTQRALCQRATTGFPDFYREWAAIYTNPISAGTSRTVTVAETSGETPVDGWLAFHIWEVSGQHATPIGATASPSPAVSTSTFTTTLSAAPAASSIVFGVIHDDNQTGPAVVEPSGWTESDEQSPAWGAISEWAYDDASVQGPQWSGFTNSASVRVLGCAVEIVAAAAVAGKAPPFSRRRIPPILMRK